MVRLIIFLLIILAVAFGFVWLADRPGTIILEWEWLATQLGEPGGQVEVPLMFAVVALVFLILLVSGVLAVIQGLFALPAGISGWFQSRKREKGYRSLSKGLIAASSGDVDTARAKTKESQKLLGDDTLVKLLATQTALLEGRRDEARENFAGMLEDDETRLVALRGLYLEAERQNVPQAARHYAEAAVEQSPSLPWAGSAKLRYEAMDGDWHSALRTLEANRSAGLLGRDDAKRKRAVLLTAQAMEEEAANPDEARKHAKEAHKLAKDLVPAAVTYAAAAGRQGDIRGASKVLEASWKNSPHPEIADAYLYVRAGDSVQDRLKRAKRLAELKPNHSEGAITVAQAAIDGLDWKLARQSLAFHVAQEPTRRICLLMARIEEGEEGDKGRMRDWLARAVRAPADPAWVADGEVFSEWMPVSPISGEVDAFEWKQPVSQLGLRQEETLALDSFEETEDVALSSVSAGAIAGVATTQAASVAPSPASQTNNSDVEDAQIVGEDESATSPRKAHDLEVLDEAVSSDDKKQSDTSALAMAAKGEFNAENDAAAKEPKETSFKPDTSEEKLKEDGINASDAAMDKEDDKDLAVVTSSKSSDSMAEMADRKHTAGEKAAAGFSLERRPDDPGPHPDKEKGEGKGFRFFG